MVVREWKSIARGLQGKNSHHDPYGTTGKVQPFLHPFVFVLKGFNSIFICIALLTTDIVTKQSDRNPDVDLDRNNTLRT